MILPSTYTGVMLCLFVSMVCFGSWGNLLKLSQKWRYELFYIDFSLGAALIAIIAAATLGSMNPKELTFQDNLLIASYHKMTYAAAGGAVFNLANLLLTGALSIAPLSVAFPLAGGVGLAVGIVWTLFPPQGSVLLLSGGAVVVLIAAVLIGFTFSASMPSRSSARKSAPGPRSPSAKDWIPAQPAAGTGIALSVLSGVVLGMVPPLITTSRTGEDGLAAYTAGLIFGLAVLLSTALFAPFFFSFPVHGEPVHVLAYLKGSKAQHLCGLFAGGVWIAGLIAGFASGGPFSSVQATGTVSGAFAQGAVVLAALWGLLAWREFRGGGARVILKMSAILLLWIAGAAMIVLAPGVGK